MDIRYFAIAGIVICVNLIGNYVQNIVIAKLRLTPSQIKAIKCNDSIFKKINPSKFFSMLSKVFDDE